MPRIIASIVLAIIALVALSLAGCSSGGKDTDDTSREISDTELSQMVLNLGLFGPEYAAFTPDAENTGPMSIERAAEDDSDPVAERADLENFKYLTGHEAFYSGNDPAGAFFLGSAVGIFETAEGARDYLTDSVTELDEELGVTKNEVTLKEVETFEVDVADQGAGGWGVVNLVRDDGSTVEYWFTVVSFRRGRLNANVAMYALGASDLEKTRLESKVESLAEMMNEQMAAVLAAGGPAPAAANQ